MWTRHVNANVTMQFAMSKTTNAKKTIAFGLSKKNEREKDDSIWDVKKKTNAK